MAPLRLHVLSLRYSSWSMRPWLALTHAGAEFVTETVNVELGKRNPNDPKDAIREKSGETLAERRRMGSVTGLLAPRIPVYDEYMRSKDGNPDDLLHA